MRLYTIFVLSHLINSLEFIGKVYTPPSLSSYRPALPNVKQASLKALQGNAQQQRQAMTQARLDNKAVSANPDKVAATTTTTVTPSTKQGLRASETAKLPSNTPRPGSINHAPTVLPKTGSSTKPTSNQQNQPVNVEKHSQATSLEASGIAKTPQSGDAAPHAAVSESKSPEAPGSQKGTRGGESAVRSGTSTGEVTPAQNTVSERETVSKSQDNTRPSDVKARSEVDEKSAAPKEPEQDTPSTRMAVAKTPQDMEKAMIEKADDDLKAAEAAKVKNMQQVHPMSGFQPAMTGSFWSPSPRMGAVSMGGYQPYAYGGGGTGMTRIGQMVGGYQLGQSMNHPVMAPRIQKSESTSAVETMVLPASVSQVIAPPVMMNEIKKEEGRARQDLVHEEADVERTQHPEEKACRKVAQIVKRRRSEPGHPGSLLPDMEGPLRVKSQISTG